MFSSVVMLHQRLWLCIFVRKLAIVFGLIAGNVSRYITLKFFCYFRPHYVLCRRYFSLWLAQMVSECFILKTLLLSLVVNKDPKTVNHNTIFQ